MSSSASCLCLREERETTRRSVVQVLHKEIHHDDGHKGEEHGDDVDHEAGGPVALSVARRMALVNDRLLGSFFISLSHSTAKCEYRMDDFMLAGV